MYDPRTACYPVGRGVPGQAAGVEQQGYHIMHRFALIVLVGLSLCGQAAAGWADALFEQRAHDFGSVPHGRVAQHLFKLTNTTRTPVQIANVRVSCGCVSAHAQQTLLQPGESTVVVANMDTSRFYNHRSVTVYVTFGQPQYDEVHLVVSANSRGDVNVTPDALAFGRIQRGSNPSHRAHVAFYGGDQWQVSEVRAESNYVKPSVKEIRRGNGEVVYEVSASLRSDTPVGKWYTDLWVKTNNPAVPQVRVPLTVEIEPSLNVTPKVAQLGEVKPGGTTEKKVIIQGAKPFKITKIQGADDQLVVTDSTQDAKQVHVLTLAFKADKAGERNWKLRVQTDLPDEGEIAFPATAKVVP